MKLLASAASAILGIVLATSCVVEAEPGVGAELSSPSIGAAASTNAMKANLPKYAERRRQLKKKSKNGKGKGSSSSASSSSASSQSTAGGRADATKDVGSSSRTKGTVDLSALTPNGGTVASYEFTTPGQAAIDNMADGNEFVVEDVVDISTDAPTTVQPTAGPTATPSESPVTSAPTPLPSKSPVTSSPTPLPSKSPVTSSPTPWPSKSPVTSSPTPLPSKSPSTPEPTTPSPTATPTASLTVTPPCGMSSLDRSAALTLLAVEASGTIEADTPHQYALDWLIDHDAYMACPDDTKTLQRYTLAVFYYSTSGDAWKDCSAADDFSEATCDSVQINLAGEESIPKVSGNNVWLSPTDECTWAGIACCEEPMTVDRIEFEGNGLGGSLPSELAHLTDLRFLYIERGELAGTIPESLGDLNKLIVLDLDYNSFSGSIPESLYGLSNLVQLDLNDNALTGTISSSIGIMTELRFFQVGSNPITGTIPFQMGAISLAIGGFELTELTGQMPSSVCNNLAGRLVADCAGDDPKLECGCCTECLGGEGTSRWFNTIEPTAEPTAKP